MLPDQFLMEVKTRRNLLVRDFLRENVLTMTAHGNSMAPTIEDGSEVHVQSRLFYQVGEIVLYESKFGDLTLHRIVGRSGPDLYFLKGDNEDYTEVVPWSSVYGRITRASPRRRVARRLVSQEIPEHNVFITVSIVNSRLCKITLEGEGGEWSQHSGARPDRR